MAAKTEDRLISKVMMLGDYTEVLSRGVDSSWFVTPESKAVFKFIEGHVAKYGDVPSAVVLKKNHPTYSLFNVKDSIEYLLDELTSERRKRTAYNAISDAVSALSGDRHEDAISIIRAGLQALDMDTGPEDSDVDITEGTDDRFARYETLRDSGNGMLGVATGFTTIDRATAGLQPGQLVTIVASPKTGKSILALKMASFIHATEGLVPMYQSFEMSNLENQERFDALRAGVSHNALRRGTLTPVQEKKYLTMLNDLSQQQSFLMTDSTAGTTVSMLGAKIAKYDPDIVFVDGMYLMVDERTGEVNTPLALTNLTRSLKMLAQRTKKPIVITTQALLWKMKGTRMDSNSIGYCVDTETEIFTQDRGFVSYQELGVGDTVMTLNHSTGMSEWQPVQAVNVFPAQPRVMLKMETRTHSSLSTREHRWPVIAPQRWGLERRWATSETLKGNDRILNCAPHAEFPSMATHTDEMVELVAWLWTEGSVQAYGNVTISQDRAANPTNVDRIKMCLEKEFGPPTPPASNVGKHLSLVWRESERRGRSLVEFWLSKPAAAPLLVLAPDKVPSVAFLRSLTKEQLDLFIEVSYLADGHNSKARPGNALSQKDRKRAEAFQYALILAGRPTSLVFRPEGDNCSMWQVTEKTSEWFAPVPTARLRPESIQFITHGGEVWCPTTPNSTWLARRDGKVYFTGNSSSFLQDSDVVLGLERIDGDEFSRLLRIIESRNCGPAETILQWDWEGGIFEELTAANAGLGFDDDGPVATAYDDAVAS